MLRYLFIIPILSQLISVSGQDQETVPDTVQSDEMLVGFCSRQDLESGYHAEGFFSEYGSYEPDGATLASVDPGMAAMYSVTIVLGTWCSDSRREIPRFFAILDQIGIGNDNLSLIAVDREKMAPGTNVEELFIERVPTIIFYLDGLEMGRIIETPRESLEKDMLGILTQ